MYGYEQYTIRFYVLLDSLSEKGDKYAYETLYQGIKRHPDFNPIYLLRSISADFFEKNDKIYLSPYATPKEDEEQNTQCTIHVSNKITQSGRLKMVISENKLPSWTAAAGFAGSTQIDEDINEVTSYSGKYDISQTWEISIEKLVNNLEFLVRTIENTPLSGKLWKWAYLFNDFKELTDLYFRAKSVQEFDRNSIARFELVIELKKYESDINYRVYPTHCMMLAKSLSDDIKALAEEGISEEQFISKYGNKMQADENDTAGYIPVCLRKFPLIERM